MKRIAFLHSDPRPGDIDHNVACLEHGISKAARSGANWVLTPELATTGYSFHEEYGTDWIGADHDARLEGVVNLAAGNGLTIFLGAPERDEDSGQLFNALKVIDGKNGWVGSHRKINTLPVGSEAWSSPGARAVALPVDGFGIVGLFICADACVPDLAVKLKQAGAKAIISAANWFPGELGPAGEWERISQESEVPLFVCNRTGIDSRMSFTAAESVVASDRGRVFSFSQNEPAIVFVDWDFSSNRIVEWWSEPL